MKKAINVLLVLAIALVIAAAVVAIKTFGSDDESAKPTPKDAPIVYMTTGGVKENIERHLGEKTGRVIEVRCPKKVNEAIGTTFRCSVRYAGREDRLAIASVKIDGPQGEFSWKSESLIKKSPATPTLTPAP